MAKIQLELKWGIIFTLVALLWMYMEKALGWHDTHIDKHAMYTNLFAIPAILMVVLALREKRKALGGTMTWKQGFVCGLIITAVIVILSPLGAYITHTVITPEYFGNAIAYGVESGKTSQEAAEKYFNLPSYIIQGAIGAAVMGTVTSAIVALFMRRS